MNEKLLQNLLSVKCGVIILASIFLWYGKIADHMWVEIALVVLGFRTATEITSIVTQKDDDKGG